MLLVLMLLLELIHEILWNKCKESLEHIIYLIF